MLPVEWRCSSNLGPSEADPKNDVDPFRAKCTIRVIRLYRLPREENPNPFLQARFQVVKIGSEALLKCIDGRAGIRIVKVEFVAVCRVLMEEALGISIIVLEVNLWGRKESCIPFPERRGTRLNLLAQS